MVICCVQKAELSDWSVAIHFTKVIPLLKSSLSGELPEMEFVMVTVPQLSLLPVGAAMEMCL